MVIIYNVTEIGGFCMWYLMLLLLLIALLFVPIHIKIKIIYQNEKVCLYVFNKEIKRRAVKRKSVKKNFRIRKLNLIKKFTDKFRTKNIMNTLSNINKNNYKPHIKFSCELNYGFDDAAVTGFSSGILNSCSFVLYKLVEITLKIKNYEFTIIPDFNNTLLNISVTCIISFNIVKIIYMLLIILRCEEV